VTRYVLEVPEAVSDSTAQALRTRFSEWLDDPSSGPLLLSAGARIVAFPDSTVTMVEPVEAHLAELITADPPPVVVRLSWPAFTLGAIFACPVVAMVWVVLG
jgi:hypothetical protein